MARPRPAERSAATRRKRPWWLIAVGLGAALLIAVATLPATILSGPLSRAGLDAASLSGSVWNGHARALAWRSVPLGDLRWSFAPGELLHGRLGGDLELTRPDGSLTTRAGVSAGGELHLRGTQASLPVEALATLPIGLPRNWRGRFDARFSEIVVADGWPAVLHGTLEMDGLVAPPPRNTSIGSYRVEMPDPTATAGAAGELNALVTDKEGPFSFEGRFTLLPDRSYLLEGLLAPRGSTPPELLRSLELLGPPDADGRRPVGVSGTL